METQKILKPESKLIVIADYRERELVENLKNLGVSVTETNLHVGDFICSDGIAIERKTHSDFVSSIIDGRIFQQVKLLKENYEKPIIIIEGYSDRKINENALKAAIASLITKFNVSLISTKNSLDTARMIFWLTKKEQEEEQLGIGFKHGKKPKSSKELQEFIVSSIPGISTVLSKRLLKRFGTIEKIFTASENEFMKVDGIGKKLANKIKKLLTSKYS